MGRTGSMEKMKRVGNEQRDKKHRAWKPGVFYISTVNAPDMDGAGTKKDGLGQGRDGRGGGCGCVKANRA